jgi:4-aminobutyrate aminotransferase-like enzyme
MFLTHASGSGAGGAAGVDDENLAERAATMGAYLKSGLLKLQDKYEIIGDVRGRGLLLGVELVKDRDSRTPDFGDSYGTV